MGHVASKGLGVSWVQKGLILDSGQGKRWRTSPGHPRTTSRAFAL